jgi:hypothetical protein
MFEVQPRPKGFVEGKGKEEEIRGAFDDFIVKPTSAHVIVRTSLHFES